MQVTLNRDGQQMGPYTVEQINEYLAQGSLLPTDYAWHEGLPDWVPVTQISGVGSADAPPPFNPAQTPAVASEGNAKKKKLLLIGGIAGGVALIAAIVFLVIGGSNGGEFVGSWDHKSDNDILIGEDGTGFYGKPGDYEYDFEWSASGNTVTLTFTQGVRENGGNTTQDSDMYGESYILELSEDGKTLHFIGGITKEGEKQILSKDEVDDPRFAGGYKKTIVD